MLASNSSVKNPIVAFFDNLPELLRPEKVAELFDISVKTIYDWRYKQRRYKVPSNLFLKFNRVLYLNTRVLKEWLVSQNPSFV